jgi:hypothetical protein
MVLAVVIASTLSGCGREVTDLEKAMWPLSGA